jgi:hypothetical protein
MKEKKRRRKKSIPWRKFLKIKHNHIFFIRQTTYANTVAIKSKLPFSFHGLLNYTHAEVQAKKN